jgi:addiction module HigA family antidote
MTILNGLPPIPPGTIFLEFVMARNNVSRTGAASRLGVTLDVLDKFINGEISINDDWANRLSKFSGCSKDFWIELQTNYDVAVERSLNP